MAKTATKQVTLELAENIANTKYEKLPDNVVNITKKSILDVLGTTLAGGALGEGCKEIVDLATEWNGNEEATILGYGHKVPCLMAAFANGVMSHAVDYDDIVDEAWAHPTITTVPAALAIAERRGNVSGKEFITAITMGNDLIVRLGLSITQRPSGWSSSWLVTTLMGVFSACASVGKLLGLSGEQIADALGIVLNQAGGAREMARASGTMIRGHYAGGVAMAGMMAAMMANKGITGPRSAFEGVSGLYNAYFGGEYDINSLTDGLGSEFRGDMVGFKPWPSCRISHAHIDAALSVVREHDIRPEQVDNVVLGVGDQAQDLCVPPEVRRRPTTTMEAKFSVPYTVAAAILHRDVTLNLFSPQAIREPAILELTDKITHRYEPSFGNTSSVTASTAQVEIGTHSGATYSKKAVKPYGHPENPISASDLTKKFRDCASYSVKPIDSGKIDEVIALVTNLEEVDDVGILARLLG
ncbi:MmgE/PrpD family protein [Chloroflexota bacterium]